WTARLALRSLQFWLLFIARIAAAAGTTVIVTHQVAHVVDVGFSKLLSASIFGLAGVTSSFGRVIFGFIADRLSKPAAYTLNIAMTVVGVGALMILRDPSQAWLLYVYVIFFPARASARSSATRPSRSASAARSARGWAARFTTGPAVIWFPSRSRRSS